MDRRPADLAAHTGRYRIADFERPARPRRWRRPKVLDRYLPYCFHGHRADTIGIMEKDKSKASRRGRVARFVVLSLVPVLGMIGLGVGAGWAYLQRDAAQAAAQRAAIAGIMVARSASNFTCGDGVVCQTATACPATLNAPGNPIQAACLYARQAGFTNGAHGGTQTVTIAANTTAAPVSGTSPSYWISATVSQKLPLKFLAVLGQPWRDASANSTAAVFGGGGGVIVIDCKIPCTPAQKSNATLVANTGE